MTAANVRLAQTLTSFHFPISYSKISFNSVYAAELKVNIFYMLVMFKGIVSPIENWLKVVPWDRPCLTHQALAILEIINSNF
jgi:hypothetical protein